MSDHFYVYVLYRDAACADPFYVGKGHGNRIHEHETKIASHGRQNSYKSHTVAKCLRELGFVPKEIFKGDLNEADAFRLERNLIAWWGRANTKAGRLTNATDGGEGTSGTVYTAEQRARMSAAHKGIKLPPRSAQARANISAALTGKPKTAAHREKLRLANLGKTQSLETRMKNSASNKGRIVSDTTRHLLSIAHTGRPRSAEHCANISAARKGQKQSPEIIERQRATRAITMHGRPGPNLGRVFSPEVREKMRQSHLRRWANK